MKFRISLIMIAIVAVVFTTGCWDQVELNDRAIEMAWGIDQVSKSLVEISAQVIIPSRMQGQSSQGSQQKTFQVVSGRGINTLEAVQDMQRQLSRVVFRSHRRAIFFGEDTAKQGLTDILDTYTRDPEIRLRTDVFVVKGMTAKDFLSVSFPFESIPGLGALKEHTAMGGWGTEVFLDFLLSVNSEGTAPTLPLIQVTSQHGRKTGFEYSGRAIFNKQLRMVGELSSTQAQLAFWIKSKNRYLTIGGKVPPKGNVAIVILNPRSHIVSHLGKKSVRFVITLYGDGNLRENNTELDMSKTDSIHIVERALERQMSKRALALIAHVQKDYGEDIFGFGDTLHIQHPYYWKKVKGSWDSIFRHVQVRISTRISIKRVGLTGLPLHNRK